MSLRHLASGSINPPLKKGTLRIYSAAFCPYAHRARLVLAAKKIPHEVVNINLKTKPDWFLELNPAGTVPCIQHDDGRTLPESLLVADYLDELYPQNRLTPSDPYAKASQRLTLEIFNKVATGFFKTLTNKNDDGSEFLASLEPIEKRLVSDYFGGDKPRMIDYMIWPWFERLSVLKILCNIELDKKRFPKLTAYIKRMSEQHAVRETIIPGEVHAKFMEKFLSGQTPDYDLGLLGKE